MVSNMLIAESATQITQGMFERIVILLHVNDAVVAQKATTWLFRLMWIIKQAYHLYHRYHHQHRHYRHRMMITSILKTKNNSIKKRKFNDDGKGKAGAIIIMLLHLMQVNQKLHLHLYKKIKQLSNLTNLKVITSRLQQWHLKFTKHPISKSQKCLNHQLSIFEQMHLQK